ncbi:copper chaperone CopZ [Agromyces cerinus]|uniref:heavy-metal-associated domain-containing protein n=1 Tax=Agromyces cerinus TaxID=33878 RepID=UPI00195A84F2|nr:heavy-metal-associated domain-containing protein [Agromyces cerinus]MBM7832879.1 copper chaperone CopZ [Agromyces cerinus]
MTLAPEGRTEIDLDGGGCSCCAIDSSTDASAPAETAIDASLVEATFGVSGMTCGSCVAHVTQELTAIDGVDAVEVELVNGGVSGVTVRSSAPISDAAIAAAVEEAGYRVAER